MINYLIIEAKIIGYRKPVFPLIEVPLPPDYAWQDKGLTLKELLEILVRYEVQSFRSRLEANLLTQVLTPKQIELGATDGKIISGQSAVRQEINEEESVVTVWQSFEDGFFLAFVDSKQYTRLEEAVMLKPDLEAKLTLVRLVPLAGG